MTANEENVSFNLKVIELNTFLNQSLKKFSREKKLLILRKVEKTIVEMRGEIIDDLLLEIEGIKKQLTGSEGNAS